MLKSLNRANITIFFKETVLRNYYICGRLDKFSKPMATFRQRALNEASMHKTGRFYIEEGPVSSYFGKNVLDLEKMKDYI